MVRRHFAERAERVGHEDLALCLAAHLDDLLHRDVFFDADQSVLGKQDDAPEETRVNGFVHERHLSVLHAHVEKALHFCQGIFLDLLGDAALAQSQLGLDQHGYQLAGAGLMSHFDLAFPVDDRRVCGTAAHVKDRQGELGSRRCQRAEACHYSFHACDFYFSPEFGGQPGCDLLHGELLGLDHGCDAHSFFQAGLACQGS